MPRPKSGWSRLPRLPMSLIRVTVSLRDCLWRLAAHAVRSHGQQFARGLFWGTSWGTMPTPGVNIITWTIADAVVRVLDAARRRCMGGVPRGDSRENYTKRMIVDRLCRIIPRASVRFREGRVDPRNYCVSFEKIFSHLNFRPTNTVPAYLATLVTAVSSGQYPLTTAESSRYTNRAPRYPGA
jgi:hypothetical protein